MPQTNFMLPLEIQVNSFFQIQRNSRFLESTFKGSFCPIHLLKLEFFRTILSPMIHFATKEFLFLPSRQNRFSELFGGAPRILAVPGFGKGAKIHIFSMAVALRGSRFTRYWNQTLAPGQWHELLLEFYYFYTRAICV